MKHSLLFREEIHTLQVQNLRFSWRWRFK